jgi:diguanylate cyclase (GGDEF)-like protein
LSRGTQNIIPSTIIADVATSLMGVRDGMARPTTEAVLADLARCFSVDSVHLRHHDEARRCSTLVAQFPAPDDQPDARSVEPTVMSFSEPAVSIARRQSEVVVSPPGRPGVGKRVLEHTLLTVPVIQEGATVGIMGLASANARTWHDDEIGVLTAVSTLFAQFWARLDAERRLAHQLNHDELTGLANRRKLTSIIAGLPPDRPASVLIIGIDNMKVINDGLDFEVGNRFIKKMAERLVASIRADGEVARLDGDQFAVLVLDTSPGQVERLTQRLLEELAATVNLDAEIAVARSVSIGIAHNYVSTTNAELLAEADAALFQAKRRGKKRAAVFDEEMRAKVIDRFETEIELRAAIENGELTLHYQPEIDLGTGRICAVEALVRWEHPKRGLLPAGVFIDTAEESGLIVEIGDQVLDMAIAQLARWLPDHPDLEMWVNVSPAQLMSRDIAGQVAELLQHHDVPADRVCLEVTEHVMLGDLDATTGVLQRIRDMGVKLALDDFGTGYSSMKQLKQLPITSLKIDRAFVSGLGLDEYDSAIVDAAINLAQVFKLGTVAEGVETAQQVDELQRRGCQKAQGYLFGKPAPPDEVAKMLGTPVSLG